MIKIRDLKQEDLETLLDIYTYYVENTAISFETVTPSYAEFRRRAEEITRRYPYLVIEKDGKTEGYAYAHLFVGRDAYSYSCEMTIYLRHGSGNQGLGRRLYEELEGRLKKMGITNLYACIGVPEEEDIYLTYNSRDFHKHMGYETTGTFRNCGRKFGRWYSMVWMEKIIGEHKDDPEPVRWISSSDIH
ncbi:MAG: N-acetyltransferase [Clostridiales bacterium]|nr:N-acetyltransferase [Clostridiales bacterium]